MFSYGIFVRLHNLDTHVFNSAHSLYLLARCRKSRACWPTGRAPIWLATESWFLKERFVCSEPRTRELSSCLTSFCSLPRNEKKPTHTRLTSWSVTLLLSMTCPKETLDLKTVFLTWLPTCPLQCCNLMLVEVIPKEPLSFSVFHYKNPKLQHTVQVHCITKVQDVVDVIACLHG